VAGCWKGLYERRFFLLVARLSPIKRSKRMERIDTLDDGDLLEITETEFFA
jgi:hypothetical protein